MKVSGKNIIYKSSIIAETVHIGDIYNFHNETINIPLDLTLLPIVYNDEVIGRDFDLDNLINLIARLESPITVKGIAGIGKTMLVRYLVSQFRNNFNYILWITYSSSIKESIVYNFQLIDSLSLQDELKGLDQNKEYLNLAFDIIINRIRQLRKSTKQKNLLIFDNLEIEESEISVLNSFHFGNDWSIIFTSRDCIPWTGTFIVEALKPLDCKQLFLKLYDSKITSATEVQIESIIELIEYNTLLIELLAKTSKILELNPETLLEQLVERGLNVNKSAKVPIRHSKQTYATGVLQYIVSIFDFAKIEKDEMKVLVQISLIPSKFLPLKSNDSENLFGLLMPQIDDSEEKLIVSLKNCIQKGLLNETEDRKLIKMHKMIQESIQATAVYTYDNSKPIIDFLHKKFDTAPNYDLFDAKRWLEYAKPVLKLVDSSDLTFVELLTRFSWFATEFELHSDALITSEKAVKLSHLLNSPKLEAACMSNCASLYDELNKCDEAIILYNNAIKLAIDEYPVGHKEIALYRSNLALAYRKIGDVNNSIKQLKLALADSDSENFSQPELKVLFHHNLACVYNDIKDSESAIAELDKEKLLFGIYKFDTFRIAAWEFENGRAYAAIGDKARAEVFLENALQKFTEIFGEFHSRTQKAKSLINSL